MALSSEGYLLGCINWSLRGVKQQTHITQLLDLDLDLNPAGKILARKVGPTYSSSSVPSFVITYIPEEGEARRLKERDEPVELQQHLGPHREVSEALDDLVGVIVRL